jgi:hypothetical protein
MNGSEDILNAYVEGDALRADADALLRRIHLTKDEREQIERTLRTVDEVTAALKESEPPAGMAQRLVNAVDASPQWPVPEHFVETGQGEWMRNEPEDKGGEEDLVDALLEGEFELSELKKMRDLGQLSEETCKDMDAIQTIAEQVKAVGAEPDAGARDRMLAKLREHIDATGVEESVTERLLGPKDVIRRLNFRGPDVLAASDEQPPEDDDKKD